MDIWFQPSQALEAALRKVAATVDGFDETFYPEIRPADPRHGDFQANGVLPFAKRTKANPRQLGQALADALTTSGELDPAMVSFEIAGPGFINFSLSPAFYLGWLQRFRGENDLRAAAGSIYAGRKTVIDYPSPNTAKQMHIGHLRPIVIGEAVARILAFCGADLVRDNHIGDWGTNFGTLIMGLKRGGVDLDAVAGDPLDEIERVYKEATQLEKEDPAIRDQSRAELTKLQQGDPENTTIWKRINELSMAACWRVYNRLAIAPDVELGESFYRDKVGRIYEELTACGLAEESEGALVVFNPELAKSDDEPPFIIRKRDGSSNYASTDLATILYRVEHFGAREIVYITDDRQKRHFEELFTTARKWFEKTNRDLPGLHHLTFGKILDTDGKPLSTRKGGGLRLQAILDEAEERALAIVNEKSPDLSENERREIARVVGIGAVKYADVMQNRGGDYVFSWDKLLTLDGNSAPYLLMAVARIHSIFRKGDLEVGDATAEAAATPFETDTEIALARKLVQFTSALEQAIADLRPHFIATYLYELSNAFSTFYNADRVNVDEAPVRARRLLLCARTLRILETGLHLLGLETLKRM